jgi:phosphocarrier protein
MSATLDLFAPFTGPVVPLAKVPDPVFAGLVMGDGLAIEPLSSVLLAPCDGVVSHLARTAHALTITAPNGAEVLIHIGIDTVKLGGSGFVARVKQGEQVCKGQPLIDVDLDGIVCKVPSLMTMLVIANTEHFSLQQRADGMVTAGQSPFLTLTANAGAARQESTSGPEAVLEATVHHGGGLHARPAALVQNAARPFAAVVQIEFNGQLANAKSMVALMGLGVSEQDVVRVRAHGEDAAAAAAAVKEALQIHTEAAHAAPVAVAASIPTADGLLGGVCAAPGLAVGKVVRLDAFEPEVEEQASDMHQEFDRLAQALNAVRSEIADAVRSASQRGAQAEAEIFSAHLALADDPELIATAEQQIGQG